MAHTFDIRFARSAGLASFFEAPANRFGWKGAGKLSVDAEGISIAVKRGLLTLFARGRQRRINAEQLAEVYREGDAVRIAFGTGEAARNEMPFWAPDSETAARIVRLLPTRRTVEIEHSTPSRRGFRVDWRALMMVGLVMMAFGGGVVWRQSLQSREQTESAPPSVAPTASDTSSVAAPAIVSDGAATPTPLERTRTTRAAVMPSTADRATPGRREGSVVPGSRDVYGDHITTAPARAPEEGVAERVEPSYQQAVWDAIPMPSGPDLWQVQYQNFLTDLHRLRADYLYANDSPSPAKFRELERRWWTVTERIYNTPNYSDLRDSQAAISRAWRNALWTMSEGRSDLIPANLELAEYLSRRYEQEFR